jgi:phage shock protein PspC (stress-responsive transcriptional regulator)/predicted membrane protein
MLGGVAAGISRTYGIDVLLVRVLFVVAGVLWIGVPAYVIAWIAIAPDDGPPVFTPGRRDPKMILGLGLVALGALIAGDRVLPHGFGFGHFGWPLLLIGGGLAILLLRRRDDPRATESDVDDDYTRPPMPPTVPASDEGPEEAIGESPTSFVVPPPPVLPPLPMSPTGPIPPTAWTQSAPWPAAPSSRARRRASRYERRTQRPRSFLTPLTLSVLLIGAGLASLLQATGALDVNLTVVLAIGTGIVGVALIVGAFFGRAHTLILVGLLLLAATGISNTIDVPLRGGIGDRTYRPIHPAELQDRYQLGIGKLEIDLRDVPLDGRTTVVDAQNGIGELLVLVPSSVRVEVHAHAGAGSVRVFGREGGGWPENDERAIDGSGSGVLQLNLRVGAGEVNVRRFESGGIETTVGAAG